MDKNQFILFIILCIILLFINYQNKDNDNIKYLNIYDILKIYINIILLKFILGMDNNKNILNYKYFERTTFGVATFIVLNNIFCNQIIYPLLN